MRTVTLVLLARLLCAKEACTGEVCRAQRAQNAGDFVLVQLRKAHTRRSAVSQSCRTAEVGEACYEAVLAAQKENQDGAPASFEEIQSQFFLEGPLGELSWEPADGGQDRVCRGLSASDNKPANYRVVTATDLETCKERCQSSSGCKAVEFSGNRCELWLREVQATRPLRNFQCHRLIQPSNSFWDFAPVDGAVSRVCRGASRGDNKLSYFEVSRAASLSDCQAQCLAADLCTGVEFHVKGRCELWNRTIDAFSILDNYQCHRVIRRPSNRDCNTLPCGSCRTALPGEPCYSDVTWAMSEGIFWRPAPWRLE